MNLVLFDLDNTLLSGDTDVEWLEFLIDQKVLPPSAQQDNLEMDRRYRSGQANALEYVRFYLRFYPPHSMASLLSLREKFIATRIEPRMLPAARALVQKNNQQNLVAIITATNRFLTEPIAAAFGIEHLIATEPEKRDGRFTGRVAGVPSFREGKVRRLDDWLAGLGRRFADFRESACYSDSHNDLPLLERVSRPVAVDPDETLAREAARRGWERISLR